MRKKKIFLKSTDWKQASIIGACLLACGAHVEHAKLLCIESYTTTCSSMPYILWLDWAFHTWSWNEKQYSTSSVLCTSPSQIQFIRTTRTSYLFTFEKCLPPSRRRRPSTLYSSRMVAIAISNFYDRFYMIAVSRWGLGFKKILSRFNDCFSTCKALASY